MDIVTSAFPRGTGKGTAHLTADDIERSRQGGAGAPKRSATEPAFKWPLRDGSHRRRKSKAIKSLLARPARGWFACLMTLLGGGVIPLSPSDRSASGGVSIWRQSF